MAADNHIKGASQRDVARMFNRIAPRYDFLNRLLSFRRDVAWRKEVVARLPEWTHQRVLDLATGTADLLLAVARSPKVHFGAGLDNAEGMLVHGRSKLSGPTARPTLVLTRADAIWLPFEDNSFDAVTMAFGIRNVTDVEGCLGEMRRVLKHGGRALILEFSLPHNPVFLQLYLFYFRHVLPRIGGLVSGDPEAYRYLNETVEAFPYGEGFCDIMRGAGFEQVQAKPLTMGIATIYQGDK